MGPKNTTNRAWHNCRLAGTQDASLRTVVTNLLLTVERVSDRTISPLDTNCETYTLTKAE